MSMVSMLQKQSFAQNTKIQLAMYKRHLNREAWESRMRLRGYNANWDRFSSLVFVNPPDKTIPPDIFASPLSLGTHGYGVYHAAKSASGQHFRIGFVELVDDRGIEVGDAIIVRDVTEIVAEFTAVISFILIIGFGFGLPVLGFIYWRMDHAQNLLTVTSNSLLKASEKREKLKEKHVAELQQSLERAAAAEASAMNMMEDAVTAMEEVNQAQGDLRLAASVFSESPTGIVITDTQARILRVNRAFTEITGYTAEEVINQPSERLKSGQHDEAFYQNLWASLKETGHWEGEIWNRRKNGEIYPEWRSITAVKNSSGELEHYISSFTDIAEKKLSEKHVYHLAHYDALTDLPNRVLFNERLQQALVHSKRGDAVVGLIYIDLDNFKLVNDSMGHPVGDKLLQQVAKRLVGCVREEDTVARLGGDEFAILLNNIVSGRYAATVAEKLIHAMEEPLNIQGKEVMSAASIGISLYPEDADSADTLLQHADTALYRAKHQGRNNFQFFTEELNRIVQERVEYEGGIHKALENQEFVIYYQPQIDLGSGRVVGLEALVRWQHPEKGLISPEKFIPIAEETGQILQIGEWVMKDACRQVGAWAADGHSCRVAVNVSARQLKSGEILEQIDRVLADTGIAPELLELEITESCTAEHPEIAEKLIRSIRKRGISIAMDDFGTGYSSLSHLRRFSMDILKIDQSFVFDLPGNQDAASIAITIIAMAKSLGMKVLAEGVETEEQLKFLVDNGCDVAQGFYFSKPIPADEAEVLLKKTYTTK